MVPLRAHVIMGQCLNCRGPTNDALVNEPKSSQESETSSESMFCDKKVSQTNKSNCNHIEMRTSQISIKRSSMKVPRETQNIGASNDIDTQHSPSTLDVNFTHQDHFAFGYMDDCHVLKTPKSSFSSERASISSAPSQYGRYQRSPSASIGDDNAFHPAPSNEVLPKCQPTRTISLRLPINRFRSDPRRKVPTVYVDEYTDRKTQGRRKSSLRKAFSLLSLNSLRQDKTSENRKPVQKILRQPTKRHQRVRGLSGLAIDESNKGQPRGLQRAHTLYYPPATSYRDASEARRRYTIRV